MREATKVDIDFEVDRMDYLSSIDISSDSTVEVTGLSSRIDFDASVDIEEESIIETDILKRITEDDEDDEGFEGLGSLFG